MAHQIGAKLVQPSHQRLHVLRLENAPGLRRRESDERVQEEQNGLIVGRNFRPERVQVLAADPQDMFGLFDPRYRIVLVQSDAHVADFGVFQLDRGQKVAKKYDVDKLTFLGFRGQFSRRISY